MAESKRGHVVREILSTERRYVASLEKLVNCFHKPLEGLALPDAVHLQTIFGNVDLLLKFNMQLLADLEQSGGKGIGKIFKDFGWVKASSLAARPLLPTDTHARPPDPPPLVPFAGAGRS